MRGRSRGAALAAVTCLAVGLAAGATSATGIGDATRVHGDARIPGHSGSAFLDSEGNAIGVLSTLALAPLAGSDGVSDR